MRLRKVDADNEAIHNCFVCDITSTSMECKEMFGIILEDKELAHVCSQCLEALRFCPTTNEAPMSHGLQIKKVSMKSPHSINHLLSMAIELHNTLSERATENGDKKLERIYDDFVDVLQDIDGNDFPALSEKLLFAKQLKDVDSTDKSSERNFAPDIPLASKARIKKFGVFAYVSFYPEGGMNDFKDSFDKQEDATRFASNCIQTESDDYYDIVDMETGTLLETIRK